FVEAQRTHVDKFVKRVQAGAFTDVVLFGMGGSSLAPEVFHRPFGREDTEPRFRMLASTAPLAVRDALSRAATSPILIPSPSRPHARRTCASMPASRSARSSAQPPAKAATS